jgi:N-acetylmuramoyl-L-alanine amidase
MKKIILMFLILALICSPIATVNAEQTFSLLKVSTDIANVRSNPGTSNKLVFQLTYSAMILRLSTAKDKEGNIWYKIYDFKSDKTGYIASWLLKDTGVTIQGTDSNFTVKVKTELLNVRIGPGTEFNLMYTLKNGDKISVIRVIKRSDGEEWYKFKGNDGKFYFVAGWFTEKVVTPTPPPPDQGSDKTAILASSTDYVNLRNGPSTDFEKVALVEKGDNVKVLGLAKNKNGELWLQVTYGNYIGWVISDYFKLDPLPTLDLSQIGQIGTTSDASNLREGPSKDFKSLKVLPKGTSLTINGVAKNKESEIWYSVNSGPNFGWVLSTLLDVKKKELGVISNVTWLIAESGIDIMITGQKLEKPVLTTVDDPTREIITFQYTKLLKEDGSIDINVFPAVRVRYEASESNTIITVDLLREIPNSIEYKNDTTVILHITLPKIGEKLVEIGGRDIYAEVLTIDNKTNINLQNFLSAFDIALGNDYPIKIDFFGKNIEIDKSQISNKNGSVFIPINSLQNFFDVSVLETTYSIFIDPVLQDYKNDKDTTLKFSFPAAAKKSVENSKTTIIFNAEPGNFSIETSKHRDIDNPPEIRLNFQGNVELIANQNFVKISASKAKEGTLAGKTIIIDPGHGSYSGPYLDYGATGPTGVKESVIVLQIAMKLKKLLEADGATVILTHDTIDSVNNPTLAERVSIANSSGGDLFMSIHLNASNSKDAQGTETYYWFDNSKTFAQSIQNAVVNNLGTIDRGIKKDYLYVCRNVTTMPAILTEILFVSNPAEEAKCKDDTFLDKVAVALKEGILNYFNGQ